jgi:hypothetical protein
MLSQAIVHTTQLDIDTFLVLIANVIKQGAVKGKGGNEEIRNKEAQVTRPNLQYSSGASPALTLAASVLRWTTAGISGS